MKIFVKNERIEKWCERNIGECNMILYEQIDKKE